MGSLSDLELSDWLATRRYHHSEFNLLHLASVVKTQSLKIIVIVPARDVAQTLAGVLAIAVEPCVTAGIVASVFAIDADSTDGTKEIAKKHGATVIQRALISPELGPSLGKGDGMWRALQVTDGDIVAFLDGDTSDPDPAHLIGILGPLILDFEVQMVRGCFDRPFKQPNGEIRPHEGGRVTEMAARPMLNRHFPQLAGFRQPLAGEFAARRSLLEKLNFPVGYGIEVGTLIDTWRIAGLRGLAEVDLGTRQNQHKPLRHLGTMSLAVIFAIERRLGIHGEEKIWLPWEECYQQVHDIERPSIEEYRKQDGGHVNGVNKCGKIANGTNGNKEHSIETNGISIVHRNAPSGDVGNILQKKNKLMNGLGHKQIIRIPGVGNFRDIGGFSTCLGSRVRRHLVFRSGCPGGLSEEGKRSLQKLGIKEIYDLRRVKEVKSHMAENSVYEAWLSSVNGPYRSIIPIFRDEDGSPGNLARMLRLNQYASSSTEGFVKIYRTMLLNSGEALGAILSHLSKPHPSPILINCTAGKDRTGVIVMALLLLAGCSAQDIAKDYHLSEEGLGVDWMEEAIERMNQMPPFIGKDRRVVERVVGARTEVMLSVVAMVEEELGGIEKFLREKLKIADRAIQRSRRALTAVDDKDGEC